MEICRRDDYGEEDIRLLEEEEEEEEDGEGEELCGQKQKNRKGKA